MSRRQVARTPRRYRRSPRRFLGGSRRVRRGRRRVSSIPRRASTRPHRRFLHPRRGLFHLRRLVRGPRRCFDHPRPLSGTRRRAMDTRRRLPRHSAPTGTSIEAANGLPRHHPMVAPSRPRRGALPSTCMHLRTDPSFAPLLSRCRAAARAARAACRTADAEHPRQHLLARAERAAGGFRPRCGRCVVVSANEGSGSLSACGE